MTDPKKVTAEDIVKLFEGEYFLLAGYQREFWLRKITEALTLAAQEAREEGIKKGYIDGRNITEHEAYASGAEAMREALIASQCNIGLCLDGSAQARWAKKVDEALALFDQAEKGGKP